jgi:chromosome segregation ATPase
MDFNKFDLLESRLGALLDRLKTLDSDNLALKGDLKAAREELAAANAQLAALNKARETAVARIDALLERIAQAGLPS